MAIDLKIEIFAYKLFHTLWFDMQEINDVPDIVEIYRDECVVEDTYFEACDYWYHKAVCFRSNLFCSIYDSKTSFQETKEIKSLSDVYEYIVRICDQDDLFAHLTVFERMLSTSEFVLNIYCSILRENSTFTDLLRYGHILWAMYFDKYTDEFYEKGGWRKLKHEAKSYKFLLEFDQIFYGYTGYYLQSAKEAIVNYYHFKNAIDYEERKHKCSVPVSKLWIKFRIEQFESYINIPLSYEYYVSAYEAELLLKDLKLLLDSTRCNPDDIEFSKEEPQRSTSSSEIFSEIRCDTEELNINHDDDTQIQNLVDTKRRSKTIKSFPNAFDLDLDHRNESKSYINNKNEYCPSETFSVGNTEGQTGIANTNKVVFFPQMEKTECHRNSFPIVHTNSDILGFSNGNTNDGNEMENSKNMLKMRFCSEKGHIAEAETMDVLPINRIVASDRDGPSMEPYINDFSSVNENVNCIEMERVRKAREDLSNEQKNPEEKNLFKFLLTLGDLEGIKFVRWALENSEKGLANTQTSNKRKKKHKAKRTENALSTLQNSKECPEKSQESLNQQKKGSKK
ncbi:unnamed protein product [Larinioides sclopetarius]|uniref:Uncharacterized protein n=1 Tax=Larinioides sclopetarius TaxID=280406 RepID=A0AAV1ZXA1_9ARAC